MIWCRFDAFMAIKYSYGQERLNSTLFLFGILLTTALHLVLSPHTHKFYWTIQWIGSLNLTPAHPDIFGGFINQRGWFSYLSLCYGSCQINYVEVLLFRKHVEGNVAFKTFPVLNKNCCRNLHTSSRNEIDTKSFSPGSYQIVSTSSPGSYQTVSTSSPGSYQIASTSFSNPKQFGFIVWFGIFISYSLVWQVL